MSSDKYVKQALADLEKELEQVQERLATKILTPLASGYRPELDVSPELDAK